MEDQAKTQSPTAGTALGAPGACRSDTAQKYETIQQFAERVGVHINTVKSWLKKGLPCVRVGMSGRIVRVLVGQSDAWIAAGGASVIRRSRRVQRPI